MLNRYIWNVAPIALAQSLECNGGQYVLQLHRKYEDNNDSVQKNNKKFACLTICSVSSKMHNVKEHTN